ncbi:hypothetical protein [Streptomyces griseus]|uniref:hypothetical protein n=1 Tax=Streptomyces griseus TaxID=1911 RepID=UPI00340CB641
MSAPIPASDRRIDDRNRVRPRRAVAALPLWAVAVIPWSDTASTRRPMWAARAAA